MKTRRIMKSPTMGKKRKTLNKRHMPKMSKISTHQTGKMAYVATPSQTKTRLTNKAPLSGVTAQTTNTKMKTWDDQNR